MFRRRAKPDDPPTRAPVETPRKSINPDAMARFRPQVSGSVNPFVLPDHPPGVAPKAGSGMAMDDAFGGIINWAGGISSAFFHEGIGFAGFQQLALLAQRPEYRKIAETISTEMTRRWIKIQASGDDDDKTDKIAAINAEFDRLNVRDVFRKAAEHDVLFGGGHIYVDLGTGDQPNELTTSIGTGSDDTSKAKIGKGDLKALRNIEPAWCYPQMYNSNDPLSPNWYNPQQWLVLGKAIHATRLLTMVGRPVPDILKPAYSFRGLSMSQMAKPYVDNWLKTRQSVADIIQAFSVFVLSTDLASILGGGAGDDLDKRLALFNAIRDNRGVMAIQSGEGGESFQNVSAPLGTLDKLQAQSQEQQAAVSSIPIVKLTGITPSGLNASSDGEIRVFYDGIHAEQENKFRPKLTTILGFVQLSLFGEVDPQITFAFEPLWSMSEKEQADVRKTDAETDGILIEEGVILASESRSRVAADPDSPYASLDMSLEIDPPAPNESDPVPEPTLGARSE